MTPRRAAALALFLALATLARLWLAWWPWRDLSHPVAWGGLSQPQAPETGLRTRTEAQGGYHGP